MVLPQVMRVAVESIGFEMRSFAGKGRYNLRRGDEVSPQRVETE
jgi:hypothetical protein